ncbi:Putative inner membrane protein [Salmonella bongori]|nr:Putative inner membrane protein [Salmonella bongori]
MGLVIKAALGALVVILIGLLSKNEKLLYRRVNSSFSNICAYCALHRGQ